MIIQRWDIVHGGGGCQFLSKSANSGAVVNYLLEYCLYCVSTSGAFNVYEGINLQFGFSPSAVSAKFPFIAEVIKVFGCGR